MDILRYNNFIILLLFLLIPLGFIAESLVILLILLTYRWCNVIPVLVLILFIFAHFLINHLFYSYTVVKPFQQMVLVALYAIGYSVFFKRCVDGINIWNCYLNACFYYACIATLQGVVFLLTGEDFLGFARNVVSDTSIRLHAYFEEPGTFATFMSPCIAYFLYNFDYLKTHLPRFVLIFITYVLSLSTIGFVVILIIILHRVLCSKYKFLLFAPLIAISLYLGVKLFEQDEEVTSETGNIEMAFVKIRETANAFSNLTPGDFEMLNMSSYASLSNLWIAINAPGRMFGTGIGTHPESYDRLYQSDYIYYGLNKEDAYSLLTRVFSEFGLLGVCALFAFVRFNYNRESLINIASLYYIIASMFRGGHYTYNGLFFFFFLYYFTSKRNVSNSE